MSRPLSTGFLFDDHFLLHDAGETDSVLMSNGSSFSISATAHPSSLVITKAIKEFFDGSGLTGLMQSIAAREATQEELSWYHDPVYVENVRRVSETGDEQLLAAIAQYAPISPGTYRAALYSAGAAMNAVDAVVSNKVRNAYALLRPPGHHATSNWARGFCIFNNIVLAAYYARKRYGVSKIMIIDWDVHHGNGIQDAFYEDSAVLYVSLHQQNWYPQLSGELDQIGSGPGKGFTVNIPLSAGTGDVGYARAFEQIVLPIGYQFHPELILVAAGQDANFQDPLSRTMVTAAGFHHISEMVVRLAEDTCGGRLALLQEGGYSISYVPYCTLAVVEPLVGHDVGVIDSEQDTPEYEQCTSIYSDDTHRSITEAIAWHKAWWQL